MPAPPTSRHRAPGTSNASTPPARRCCASAAWSTSSSRCRTPSTRCGAIRCAACSAQPSAARPSVGVSLWEVPHYAEDFCAQSNAIFLRILAHALLGVEERAEWRALDGHGAAQARVAVRPGRASRRRCGWPCSSRPDSFSIPSDIAVLHDELGAPFVDGWWRGALAEAPQVSLSHTARACLVAVGAAESPVGVDLEDLGRIQQPELMIGMLTAGERAAGRRPAPASRSTSGCCACGAPRKRRPSTSASACRASRRPSRSASSTPPATARGSSSRARRPKSRIVRDGAAVIAWPRASPPPRGSLMDSSRRTRPRRRSSHRRGPDPGLGPRPRRADRPTTMLVADLDFASVDIIQLCVALEQSYERKLGFQDLLMKDGSYVGDLSLARSRRTSNPDCNGRGSSHDRSHAIHRHGRRHVHRPQRPDGAHRRGRR